MKVIKEAWYIALQSNKLRGKPVQKIIEGITMVLFRDHKNEAKALIDKCIHRGMLLSEGQVSKDCVKCPYHGWEYNGQGNVVSIPAIHCDGEDNKINLRSRAFYVCEQDDHIWVWLGKNSPLSKPFHFPHYQENGWSTFFMYNRFQAPVEYCLENFLDVPHTLFVHPGLFRNNNTKSTKVRVSSDKNSVTADFLNEPLLQGIGPRLCLPKGARMHHTDRFILPSISRVDYSFGEQNGFIITSQCTQISERETDVTTAITWQLPLPSFLAHAFLRPYCKMVINQDIRLLKKLGGQIERYGNTMLDTHADLLGSHISTMRTAASKGQQHSPIKEFETDINI